MKEIGHYVNGNTVVFIYDDGTKERYIKDGERPSPEFPESMDIKITNRCDMGCEMCSMSSTQDGAHANLYDPLLDTIKPYTELAIGGGNPLAHPDLNRFLGRMKEQRVICNLTVNAIHFMHNIEFIRHLINHQFICGVGISVPSYVPKGLIAALSDFPTSVVHTIAGYTPIKVFEQLANHHLNLLILGYKARGRGADYLDHFHSIRERIVELKTYVPDMRSKFKAVAFDNLALDQLDVIDWMGHAEYDHLYMGNDGEYTMYIDLVEGKYGKSSMANLVPIDDDSVAGLFANLHDSWRRTWKH